MAYNPFNAASGIVDYKRKWANAKAKGEDTKPYEEGAAAYYKELRDNGRGDVADYLQKSDSITAGEYLKQLQPEYGVDAASLQKKSDNLYGVGVGTMDDISKTFDKVYENNINVDPTSTGYGKNILSGYGIAADEAYKGTLGGNAEDNGGNVDSFAAANANRQKAAVLSQGYGDVLGYYNTIAGHANQHAVNKGNTVGAYLAQLQGNVNSDRDVLKTAYNGTVDLWKTQEANKTEKEVAELGAETLPIVKENTAYSGTVGNGVFETLPEPVTDAETTQSAGTIKQPSAWTTVVLQNMQYGSDNYTAIIESLKNSGISDLDKASYIYSLTQNGLSDELAMRMFTDIGLNILDYTD